MLHQTFLLADVDLRVAKISATIQLKLVKSSPTALLRSPLLFITYKELKGCIVLLFRSHGTYLYYILLTMYVNNHFKVVTVFYEILATIV